MKEEEEKEEKGGRAQKCRLLKVSTCMGDEAGDRIARLEFFFFPEMYYGDALKSHLRNMYMSDLA